MSPTDAAGLRIGAVMTRIENVGEKRSIASYLTFVV
jgi:hypothetical protein